jgi:small nuclear ribonucleoprotein (snRNP)-like protein
LKAVIVNTKTGKAFRGILWRRRAGYLVLRNAEVLLGRDGVAPVEGELVIETNNVDFLQVIGA